MVKQSLNKFLKDSSKVIVFTGAGASAHFDLETFGTFKTLFTEEKIEEREIKELIDKIIFSMEIVGVRVDIEGILRRIETYLETQKLMVSDSLFGKYSYDETIQISKTKSFFKKIDNVKKCIDKLKLEEYGHFSSKKKRVFQNQLVDTFKFYKKISDFNNRNLHIFTTNYDMTFEEMWIQKKNQKIDIKLINGIDGDIFKNKVGEWKSKIYNVLPGKKNYCWYLYRLHGCTHWYYELSSILYKKQLPKDIFLKSCIMDPGTKFNFGEEPFKTAYEKFELLLKMCKICIIIGFSFNDKDILEMLLQSSKLRNDPLVIIVIDINPMYDINYIERKFDEVNVIKPNDYTNRNITIEIIEGSIENIETQKKLFIKIKTYI
jgi:NAD-dependent SIR2 family protein deacetylase